MATSVFTDYLKTLAGYSETVDNGEATYTDFIEYQRLEARLIKDYQIGYFNQKQHKSLMAAYYDIKDGFRIVLGLKKGVTENGTKEEF